MLFGSRQMPVQLNFLLLSAIFTYWTYYSMMVGVYLALDNDSSNTIILALLIPTIHLVTLPNSAAVQRLM